MRETLTSGTVGGALGNQRFYPEMITYFGLFYHYGGTQVASNFLINIYHCEI